MLSDREIADLWSWAAAQDQGQETTQQHAFARAVERAAYERAAQECDRAFRKEWQREPLSDDERWWVSAIEPLIVLRRIDAAKLGAIADADQQGKLMIKTRLRAIADCIHALHRAHSAQPVQAMGTGATGNATNAEQGSTAHAGEMPAKLSAPSDDPIRRAEAAMGFPSNSCLSSRHAASIAETLIKYGTCPMLANDPVLCGKSILETVAELWETRAARDELRRQLAESKREPLSDDRVVDLLAALHGMLDAGHPAYVYDDHFREKLIAARETARAAIRNITTGLA